MVKLISAEDIEINQLLLSKMLNFPNWELTKVSNGKELLAQMEIERYDLVLMDIQMPEMDGIEATKIIRQHPVYFKIPIIAVSAYAFEENIKDVMQAGVNDFVPKPVNRTELVSKVNKWLRLSGVKL